MQLVAYGAQDVYLTGNPEVTFYQAKYKRHTNFAMENIEQTVNGTAANSGRVSVTVARNGDLVGDMYVELESDVAGTATDASAADCNYVAERAINNVELSIGGQRVDKHYQKWWRLYSELYLDESKKLNWGKMTTAADGKTVYLPLIFFFNRNPVFIFPSLPSSTTRFASFDLASDFSTLTPVFKVWVTTCTLTPRSAAASPRGHEYLIEQVHTLVPTPSPPLVPSRFALLQPPREGACGASQRPTRNSLWNFTTASTSRHCA